MRRLTFEGFLRAEVQRLAGVETTALGPLCARLADEPRLFEPLALWTTTRGALDRFESCVRDPRRTAELQTLHALHAEGLLEESLAHQNPDLPPEYTKAWSSFVTRRDVVQRDKALKSAVREQVLTLEAAKKVTRYRMAKDLGLNPGNLHAFLAMGNVQKVSLDRAYQLLKYLKAA